MDNSAKLRAYADCFIPFCIITVAFMFVLALFPWDFHFLQKIVVASTASTPYILGSIKLDYVGFFLPATVSLFCVIHILQKKRVLGMPEKLFLAVGVLIVLLSIIVPSINPAGYETQINLPLAALLLVVIAFYIFKNNYELALPLAYLLGFTVGFLSDILPVITLQTSSGIFGGGGIYDGIFVLPLCLVVGVWVMKLLEEHRLLRIER
jgi:hypothetical protein